MQQVVASLIDAPVVWSSADEAVATGAAVQACAVLEQVDHSVIQDRWGLGAGAQVDEDASDDNLARRRSVPRGEKHKHFPADYTLKTHVKFTSTAPQVSCTHWNTNKDVMLRREVGRAVGKERG